MKNPSAVTNAFRLDVEVSAERTLKQQADTELDCWPYDRAGNNMTEAKDCNLSDTQSSEGFVIKEAFTCDLTAFCSCKLPFVADAEQCPHC